MHDILYSVASDSWVGCWDNQKLKFAHPFNYFPGFLGKNIKNYPPSKLFLFTSLKGTDDVQEKLLVGSRGRSPRKLMCFSMQKQHFQSKLIHKNVKFKGIIGNEK